MTKHRFSRRASTPRTWIRASALGAAVAVLGAGVSSLPSTALAGPSEAAGPTDPEARRRMTRGLELFEQEEFEAAVREFEAGFAIEDDPVFLYSIGSAELRNDDCPNAVRAFKLFIAADVGDVAKKAARDAIVLCAERMAEDDRDPGPVTTPIDDPVDDDLDTSDPDDTQTKQPRGRKWYLDPVGDSLVALGAVGVGVGAGLLVGASVLGGKPQAASYADHVARIDREKNLKIAGAISAGVGGALLIGGAIRWGVVARKSKRATVGLLWGNGLTGVTLRGRF